MGGKRLPEGYVETGRWTLKQASPVDFLLAGLVGLSVPVALVVLSSLLGSLDRLGRNNGKRMGVRHWDRSWDRPWSRAPRARPRRLLPRVPRPSALRIQAVDAPGAGLLRGRPGKLPHQARVRRHGPGARGAVDGGAGGRPELCGRERHPRLGRDMGHPAQRRRVGGRHAHDVEVAPLSPHNPFRRHRRRIRRLRPGGGLNCSELMPTQPVHPE